MIPIGHPKFVYRPLTQEARNRLSKKQLIRLGIPEGYRQIYGVLAAEPIALSAREMLSVIARSEGRIFAEVEATKLSRMSIAHAMARISGFFKERQATILQRREHGKVQTRERLRLRRHQKATSVPHELNLDDAMLLYDEGISPEQISKALRLPLTKIWASIRATKRGS